MFYKGWPQVQNNRRESRLHAELLVWLGLYFKLMDPFAPISSPPERPTPEQSAVYKEKRKRNDDNIHLTSHHLHFNHSLNLKHRGKNILITSLCGDMLMRLQHSHKGLISDLPFRQPTGRSSGLDWLGLRLVEAACWGLTSHGEAFYLKNMGKTWRQQDVHTGRRQSEPRWNHFFQFVWTHPEAECFDTSDSTVSAREFSHNCFRW